MYFDSCRLPLALGLTLPSSFSGIYFRPSFHYSRFTHHSPTWQERMQQLRERFLLTRLLKHPQLKSLFCLDPFAVDAINQANQAAKAVYIADPVQAIQRSNVSPKELREELGVEPGRQIFLAFGSLADARKGLPQLIEAIAQLPHHLCRQLCLLLAGEPDRLGQEQVEALLTPIRHANSVQIITRYGYVAESDVQLYFQAADVILAPYQKHVGMSGVLLLAAAAQRPVLSSNYGLMGEMVRQYKLGLAVDTTIPHEIAQGLARFLQGAPEELCDRVHMQSFAKQNSPERFAEIIFQHLQ